MSDSIKGFIVTMEEDVTEEYAEQVVKAILCLRHVATVTPSVTDWNDRMCRDQVRLDYRKKLFKVLE